MPLTLDPSPLKGRGASQAVLTEAEGARGTITDAVSENGSLGAVRVANEVIASIAALAACEVEGVDGMDEAAARHFGDWVRRQGAHRGVRVHIEGDRSIHLEVFITVSSEAKLADVAAAVQANVVEATERMLGLEVGEVNVFVSSVAFAS